jgi:cobalt/nickel transport protein
MKKWTILILLAVVALAVVPLVLAGGAEFGGADGQAGAAISEIDPGYAPWFSSIWSPPSGEIESLLFALQAAIGAGVLFFALGYFVGRAKGRSQAASDSGAAPPPEAISTATAAD